MSKYLIPADKKMAARARKAIRAGKQISIDPPDSEGQTTVYAHTPGETPRYWNMLGITRDRELARALRLEGSAAAAERD